VRDSEAPGHGEPSKHVPESPGGDFQRGGCSEAGERPAPRRKQGAAEAAAPRHSGFAGESVRRRRQWLLRPDSTDAVRCLAWLPQPPHWGRERELCRLE